MPKPIFPLIKDVAAKALEEGDAKFMRESDCNHESREKENILISLKADIHHTDENELSLILLRQRAERHTAGFKKAIKIIRKLKHSLEIFMKTKADVDAALDQEDAAYAELISDIAALPQAEDLQAEVDRIVARAQQLRDAIATPPPANS